MIEIVKPSEYIHIIQMREAANNLHETTKLENVFEDAVKFHVSRINQMLLKGNNIYHIYGGVIYEDSFDEKVKPNVNRIYDRKFMLREFYRNDILREVENLFAGEGWSIRKQGLFAETKRWTFVPAEQKTKSAQKCKIDDGCFM